MEAPLAVATVRRPWARGKGQSCLLLDAHSSPGDGPHSREIAEQKFERHAD